MLFGDACKYCSCLQVEVLRVYLDVTPDVTVLAIQNRPLGKHYFIEIYYSHLLCKCFSHLCSQIVYRRLKLDTLLVV
jgi:hypothetical protein